MLEPLKKIAEKALKLNANKLLNEVLDDKEVQDFILYLNQQKQLFEQGLNADGVVIGYYSPATEALTNGEKRAGTPYTLRDTGAFYDSFRIKLGEQELYIEANPIKGNENLFDKYGENILGLTQESQQVLNGRVKEDIIPKIEAYLQQL